MDTKQTTTTMDNDDDDDDSDGDGDDDDDDGDDNHDDDVNDRVSSFSVRRTKLNKRAANTAHARLYKNDTNASD